MKRGSNILMKLPMLLASSDRANSTELHFTACFHLHFMSDATTIREAVAHIAGTDRLVCRRSHGICLSVEWPDLKSCEAGCTSPSNVPTQKRLVMPSCAKREVGIPVYHTQSVSKRLRAELEVCANPSLPHRAMLQSFLAYSA